MAEAAEQLVVLLEARVRDFERNMQRAARSANDNFGGIEDRGRRMGRNLERDLASSTARINNTLSGMGKGAGSAFGNSLKAGLATAAAGLSVGKLAEYVDTNTRIENSLKVAGLEGEALKKTYNDLFDSAQRYGVPLEALSTLYGRLSLAQKDLNATAPEIARFTDGVALALKVSGQSATEASGALLQLSQAMGGGKIQAEEYNSLIDGARPVLQAVAAGLEEAGGSVSKLTALVKDGKVSSEAFFRAFEAGRPALDRMASQTSATLAQNMIRVENALAAAAGEMSRLAGATDLVKQAFDGLIAVINEMPKIFEQDLKDLAKIADIAKSIAASVKTAAGTVAVLRNEPLPQDSDDPPPLAIRVRPPAPRRTLEDKATGPVKPVSLKSFKVPGEKDGKGGGSDKANEYEREVAALEKRTRALDSEREAVGKGALEAARAEAAFRLLEAAKKANLLVTDQLRAKIDVLATSYASAKVKLDEAEAAQRRVQEQQRYLGEAMSDTLGDLLIEGRSLSDVFDNLAKSLAKAALQAVLMGSGPLGGLFGGAAPAGGGMGGLFGKLLGFSEGGYTGDGGKHEPAGVVHRGEFVIPADVVKRLGVRNLEGLRRGYANGGLVGATAPSIPKANLGQGAGRAGSISIAPTVTVQMQGGATADPQANAALAAQFGQQMDAVMRGTVVDVLRQQLRPGGMFDYARR